MSTETQKAEFRRRYHERKPANLTMTRATYNKLKGYYEEYIQISAQNFLPTVNFHDFVIQYAELGYLNSRSKLKGK